MSALPKIDPNGLVARTLLAFLATAGLYYVNIMPAIVDGLIEALGFTSQQAGNVGSANMYGAAAGALTIVFLVKRLKWRPTAFALLTALILTDLFSMLLADPNMLISVRFVHGVIGGGLVGVGFAIIARTVNPDRTFGVLLVVQFGLGGLGNLYLPRLVPTFGVDVLFIALILFSIVTALMIPLLPEYAIEDEKVADESAQSGRIAVVPLALTLAAIFLFQAGNMGLFAFIIGLGKHYELGVEFITWTLALSGWIGILGAVIVIALYTKFGRFRPLLVAMILTAIGIWVLHFSDNAMIFMVANCAMGITWAFVIPYLLGLCSEFDKAGRMAALGGFASKMGLASGPMVAGALVGEANFTLLINVGAIVVLASLVVSAMPAIRQDRAGADCTPRNRPDDTNGPDHPQGARDR